MSDNFSPVYSTHGHARKTHLAVSGDDALCGIQKQFPDLLWCRGEAQPLSNAREYVEIDSERYGCGRCKVLLLTYIERQVRGQGMSTSSHPWHPRLDYRSWNLVRPREGARSVLEVEMYVSPGKSRPRRWPTLPDAQAFADTLNGQAPAERREPRV